MDYIVAHESIDKLPVRVQRITDASQGRLAPRFPEHLRGRQVVRDLAVLDGSDALTVSDAPDFIERGGMIQLILQVNHVRFDVSLYAVERTPGSELGTSTRRLLGQGSAAGGGPAMRLWNQRSIAGKLTRMNLLVSGAALVLAYVAFLGYDLYRLRQGLFRSLSTEAGIVGANSVTALLFHDQQAAENTLLALPTRRSSGQSWCGNNGQDSAQHCRSMLPFS